jgi:hypothetical protein
MRGFARSVFTALSLIVLVVGAGMAQAAPAPKEKVLFQAKMKSEQELVADALAGKRDPGLENLKIETRVLDENGKKTDVNVKKYYTVQKIKQVQKGEMITTDFVVLGSTVIEDDPKGNSGVNFTQYFTGYFTTTNIGTNEYAKGTRYEAKFTLHDGNLFRISNAVINAKTEGRTPSGQNYFNQQSPMTISPVNFGPTYVKTPTWDYVNLTGSGYAGAVLTTKYTVRSSSGTVESIVALGTL